MEVGKSAEQEKPQVRGSVDMASSVWLRTFSLGGSTGPADGIHVQWREERNPGTA